MQTGPGQPREGRKASGTQVRQGDPAGTARGLEQGARDMGGMDIGQPRLLAGSGKSRFGARQRLFCLGSWDQKGTKRGWGSRVGELRSDNVDQGACIREPELGED